METVASVPGYEGSLKASDVIKTVAEFFDSIGNTAENEELGSIVLQRRGVKNDIAHGIGREKAAAFMAVPDVLKHGKVVDYQGNWKGRGYDTAIIAAPIQISGEDYFAGVCVKSVSGENKFYVHEVLSIKEGATPFNRAALETSVDSGGDTPSINNILSELIDVKENLKYSFRNVRDAEGKTLTENQERYFENSEVRDDYGNLLPVYHATDNDFFTFDREKLGESTLANAMDAGLAATSLVGHWFSDHDTGKQMRAGRSIKSYLNIENPYYATLDGLAEEIGGYADDYNQMQEDFENGDYDKVREAAAAFVDYLRNRGYDGLIVDDPEMGGTSYVVLDSEQAKLVSNENPTGNPDIRYSSRNSGESRVDRLVRKNEELKAEGEYLKQVVQIQKKHHLPESAAFLPVTAPIRGRTGPAYRGPHGRRRRARAGR